MAIKGLTDRVVPAFPRIGKLRKGGARPDSGRAPGRELSYWRFTSENPEVEAAFVAAYGAEPTELDVFLPFASIEDNWGCWKEKWVAGGLEHRCDGEACTVRMIDGTYDREPAPCPGGCKEVGRLAVILPMLLRAGRVGYVTMETHSLNDIANIQATLMATAQSRGQDDMRGIPFTLRRVKRIISTPSGDGKRARREKVLVELVPSWQWVSRQIEAAQSETMALPAPPPAQIPATIDPDTGEILDPPWEEEEAVDGEVVEAVVAEVVEEEPAAETPVIDEAAWKGRSKWFLGQLEVIGVTIEQAQQMCKVKSLKVLGTPQDALSAVRLALAEATGVGDPEPEQEVLV